MKLSRHKIQGVPYEAAKAIYGPITPEIVIVHDTASRLEKGNAANYLRDNRAGVSVHFVIEVDGSIEQQVPTNRKAGHAGRSQYNGRSGCNNFSIGIELVNPGRMTWAGEDQVRTWYGETFSISENGVQDVGTENHGYGYWMPYSTDQLDAVEALLHALFAGVDTLKDIVSHWYVSPGRKVDTNPLFPLEQLRARVLGRDDPRDQWVDEASGRVEGDDLVAIEVPADGLNLRRWPSFNPNVLTSIPNGTVLEVERRGTFEHEGKPIDWLRVRYGDHEGWIVARYAAPLVAQAV